MEIFQTHISQSVHIIFRAMKFNVKSIKSEKNFAILQNHWIDAIDESIFYYSYILMYKINI